MIISLLMLLCSVLFAQQRQETIYLKNGTVVHGTIVEYVPNTSYTIVTGDGNRFVFEIEDIARITWDLPAEGDQHAPQDADPKPKVDMFRVGYQGLVETGLGAGMGTYGIDVFKLDFINGYRFNPNLFIGGGIGYRHIMAKDGLSFLPIFANVRGNLAPKGKVIPYGSFNLGVAFNSSDGLSEGGLMVNPSFGILINRFSNYMLHASIGYDAMQMPFYEISQDWWNSVLQKRIRYSEAFVVHLGFTF